MLNKLISKYKKWRNKQFKEIGYQHKHKKRGLHMRQHGNYNLHK